MGRRSASACAARWTARHSLLIEGSLLPPGCRLVVLVPDLEIDTQQLSQKIWRLASGGRQPVLLVGIFVHAEDEYRARCRMAQLEDQTRTPALEIHTRYVSGADWLDAVPELLRPEDVLVCYRALTQPAIFRKQRVAEVLAAQTGLPVYVLNDALPEATQPWARWLIDAVLLAACLGVFALFFVIQVWIDQNFLGWVRSALQILSAVAEAGTAPLRNQFAPG